MKNVVTRKIVKIDEDKCDGCGACVPSCAEGAIKIIDGKARLVADNLCDGLGNCLGNCPKDAIRIEERPAEEFDEAAVEAHTHAVEPVPEAQSKPQMPCGCPGTMMRKFSQQPAPDNKSAQQAAGLSQSRLGHWPVQLHLLPERGDIWADANVLLSADCAAYAMSDFHERLLAGRTLAVGCPKLDDGEFYVEKLARIFASNRIRAITIARMEVPCCGGLQRIVELAMEQAGVNIPVNVVTISMQGRILDINGVAIGS